MRDGTSRKIGIERLHLEQDAGKSLHDQHPNATFVDLNRSGVALMEIVSKPDLRSAEEAGVYVRKLRSILRYLGTCDGNMDEGSMRCDVNVSIHRPGEPFGTRAEIKNVNSRTLRHARHRIRDHPADRNPRIGRHGGPGDPPVRCRRGRNPRHALQGRGPRPTAISPIPTCCRWTSTPTGSRRSRPACPSCPTRRRPASWRITGSRPMTRACWWAMAKTRIISRPWPRDATPRPRPTG